MTEKTIKLYATSWCGDCIRSKKFFDDNNIKYEYINIEDDPEMITLVENLNNGMRSVPTIVFPDNSVLVEPSNMELLEKINQINKPA